jgi:membrane protease YdiL (CAAX protease family)
VSYTWIFRRRGRLADAVVAHAVTNAALVVIAALTGAWDLWL